MEPNEANENKAMIACSGRLPAVKTGRVPAAEKTRSAARGSGLLLTAAAVLIAALLWGLSGLLPALTRPGRGTEAAATEVPTTEVPTTEEAAASEPAGEGAEQERTVRPAESVPEASRPACFAIVDDAGLGAGNLPAADDGLPAALAPLFALCARNGTPAVMIVCSHPGEFCQPSVRVGETASALGDALKAAGIEALVCASGTDGSGIIGAYAAMNAAVAHERKANPDAFLLLDLHSSDTDTPLTLTVGCGAEGFAANWRLALWLAGRLPPENVTVRLVPGEAGQGSGLLSLHVGLSAADADGATALIGLLCSALGDLRK